MPVNYRLAEPADATGVARLLEAYMLETYECAWAGSLEQLRLDAFGAHMRIAVAESDGQLIGFVAWNSSYDLHHCVVGIEIRDLFVVKTHRGRAVALGLLVTGAAFALHTGAKYLSGNVVDSGSGTRLYERAAIRHGDTFYLSGRAFRALAEADPTSPRELVKALPAREWNFEA